MKRTSYAWLLATAMVFALASTAAYADKIKTCSTDTVAVKSPGWTQEVDNVQIANCGSNSDSGADTVPGPVLNPGGKAPPAQQ